MERKRFLGVLIGISVIILLAICLAPQQIVSAQECRIVRVGGGAAGWEGKVYIEPETVFIQKDSCVVWINRARTDEIKIKFEDGKRCEDMTKAPVGFKLDAANCFVTSWVPFGGTSSLNFVEAGTYEYIVEAQKGITGKGKIIVE